ncbi:hypothetical protein PL11201_490092 [Planktothrix sp. PCC 11201]|uniref:hypothetical protein n=1 Tax=Planktothrix sp. PCC 11201 TaxID=1729650 RepID=UPI00090FCD41|nr:hypothetical protein [Planktothrix sp. PCC 11201]SKB13357.1 hypothetical protein PL11201_490092 [Planktothrix sp. PCC 11201]
MEINQLTDEKFTTTLLVALTVAVEAIAGEAREDAMMNLIDVAIEATDKIDKAKTQELVNVSKMAVALQWQEYNSHNN